MERLPIRFLWSSVVVSLFCLPSSFLEGAEKATRVFAAVPTEFQSQPQWLTGARLLRTGESIEFRFFLPAGSSPGSLDVFPRFLEQASLDVAIQPEGGLAWLDAQKPQSLPLDFRDGQASLVYTPPSPGNYLARWRVGNESLYRYFSVVDDDSIVVNFATFVGLDPKPSLHGTGIPLDYRLPVREWKAESPLYQQMLSHQRSYGDLIVLEYPDMPDSTPAQREQAYGDVLAKARTLLPDGNDLRSARVCADHPYDPGYVDSFAKLKINDHCGQWEPDGGWWLGMPEFFYFSSPADCRRINQGQGGSVVAHAWDFCASFHFLGPLSWHYAAASGDWATTEDCLTHGLDEATNMAELSNHPAFITPLYDGSESYDYAGNIQFQKAAAGFPDKPNAAFVDRYRRFIALDAPKRYKLVFSRTLDMVDYFRRHCPVTPRTVFVSKTDHPLYDGWWSGDRMHMKIALRNHWLAWDSKPSTMRRLREALGTISPAMVRNKDKRAQELIVVEDQKRSIRFERECIYPIWWFDYTQQATTEKGSPPVECVDIPDLTVDRSDWTSDGSDLVMTLKIKGDKEIAGFPICLWGIPAKWDPERSTIQTNAVEAIPVKNTDGEFHLVLFVNLKRETELKVRILGEGNVRATSN